MTPKEAGEGKGGYVDLELDVQAWVEQRLHAKFSRGFGPVLPALAVCIQTLLAIQRAAVDLGGALCVALASGGGGGKDREALAACKALVDSAVLAIDSAAAKDAFYCPDHQSILSAAAAYREAHHALRQLHAHPRLPPSAGKAAAGALARLVGEIGELPGAVECLEAAALSSRGFLMHLSETKERVLGGLGGALEEARVVAAGVQMKGTVLRLQREFEGMGEAARRACEAPPLQEVKRLKGQCLALQQRMDGMLAPFVRISQNMKGKSKVGGGDLTEEELRSIQKHIALLLKQDMYERLEDEGGIEDFLEALFLLGIAAGVGMSDANAKQSGLSRKSQAILADALDSFNADKLRSSYTEWRALHVRRMEIEPTEEYKGLAEKADREMQAYTELGRSIDKAAKEWQGHVPGYNKAVAAVATYREGLVQRCYDEFGMAPNILLPMEVPLDVAQALTPEP